MREVPRGFWLACVGVFFVGVGLRVVAEASTGLLPTSGDRSVAAAAIALLEPDGPVVRSSAPYGGLGVWIDAFDFDPAYQGGERDPVLAPRVVDEFAALGVETIYIQAARVDDRSTGRLLDVGLLADFLVRAHGHDIAVIGWYLPRFDDVDRDLDRLLAIAEFEALGHRFDGVAVDIEYIEAVPDDTERSARLVDLSQRLREARPGEALGAIVPPPVQLEVINPGYWPRFPWRDLDSSYDVWLPMAYWTTRSVESGYRDSYRYAEESTRRLRNNVGRPDLVVHIIGGIGDETTLADLDGLRRAIEDTGSVGGSIYDWASLGEVERAALPESVPRP